MNDATYTNIGKVVMSTAKGYAIGTGIAVFASIMNLQIEGGLHSIYDGYKIQGGWNATHTKIAKIYEDKQLSNGSSHREYVAAVDINKDGIFQEDELIDNLSEHSPLKKYVNTESLEKIFKKAISPNTTNF